MMSERARKSGDLGYAGGRTQGGTGRIIGARPSTVNGHQQVASSGTQGDATAPQGKK